MIKTNKLLKIAAVMLSIVAVSIIILAVWVSQDDYVPQKLGNSVSAALNNQSISSCSIVENDKYIFYVNRVKDSAPLVRIDKNSGEKKLLKKDVGDKSSSALFIYKNTLIYTKSKDVGYSNWYYDIYSCDFDGKNEKLIKGDMFNLDWIKEIDTQLPTIIVVSGVYQYFDKDKIVDMIKKMKSIFPKGELVFDATNSKGLEVANKYVKKTGNVNAQMYFSIDNPNEFVKLTDTRLVEFQGFFERALKSCSGLKIKTKIFMYFADKLHRTFVVHLKLN